VFGSCFFVFLFSAAAYLRISSAALLIVNKFV